MTARSELAEYEKAVEAYRAAMDAYRATSAKRRVLSAWSMIAARDGAMQIYHFGVTMQEIIDILREHPNVACVADEKKMHAAAKLFNRSFPNNEQLRYSIGHQAEHIAALESHAVKGYNGPLLGMAPDASAMLSNVLINRTYMATYKNVVRQYEISSNTLGTLAEILVRFYEAFDVPATPAHSPS